MADNPTLEMEPATPVKRKGVKRRMFLIGGVAVVGAGLFGISMADSNAAKSAAALTTGMAPSTVAFAAEFLSAGDAASPLTTRVEVPRYGKSLAFLRGLLEQNSRPLLSYSATIKLRPRALSSAAE